MGGAHTMEDEGLKELLELYASASNKQGLIEAIHSLQIHGQNEECESCRCQRPQGIFP